MKIRRAVPADLPALQWLSRLNNEFHAKQAPEHFHRVEEVYADAQWQQLLSSREHAVFVGEAEGVVLGFALMQLRHDSGSVQVKAKKIAHLAGIYVDGQARGQGMGKGLLQACEAWGIEKEADELGLMVWSFNQAAIRLYEGLGIHELHRQMRKPLRTEKL
ncbi:GNAT family N-acetyltransferase [Ectobacillus ponti]|uniref:GNAT family N-acetyltransferase n=1 Tax=Ectobacillus ponti TaxID=2961894 RepID=A0AA41X310_9BACI|nr:N-acetyltransferase [Ectobacillus ponti]MCP8967777.1 GNAT family N-acetyltransferase [Ectobacillus ponti]